ncbi:hypothetical protein [Synechococcus sp. RS9916]|uniref:hypothetical protein n=1 Tax=Synechococcus sp. RS9916 TaxID=221359 RepID=UPI0000E53695|nr:hypothetical protein [Synechococcus sp. RS9916]EAU74277.1 hypothetical protein RS9916_32257 [Synechococcus sp. RS9916]
MGAEMASNSDLFLQAWAGKTNAQKEAELGKALTPDQRTDTFLAAFATPAEAKLPTPIVGQNWRWDMVKLAKLSPTEQYMLTQYEGCKYRDLPSWIQDGGYVKISDSEKKYQREMLKETGLTQSERNEVVDHAAIHIGALGDMLQREVLKGSKALESEIDRCIERFGNDLVMTMLEEIDPAGAAELIKVQQIRATTAAAKDELELVSNQEAQVRAEIKEAQAAIEAMNADSA